MSLDDDSKIFYNIVASLPMAKKKELLIRAFNQGAVVIMDEINSQPMLESLLNNLLMGQGIDGKRPAKPGFTLIGTGNPIYMDGRRKMSQALKRRMMHVEFSKYSETELIEVATTRRKIEAHFTP